MAKSRYIFLLTCLLNWWTILAADENNIVGVESVGKIKGSVMKTLQGKEFWAFRGIPYAQPPIKQLRFKPPVPKSPWLKSEKPFDATTEGPECIQFDFFTRIIKGQEDCLVLNVYTQNTDVKSPVMVFIHGGGYTMGSGISQIYGPRRILDHDIVLVTFNYRLNSLGFLSTSDEASPGNYGLLDQVEVLKWVKRNIHAFGGDSNKVTIFGESAGSSSVLYHMLSPLSKELFHGAIAMSGNPLCPFAHTSTQLTLAEKLGDIFNCPKATSNELVECLRKISAKDITEPMTKFITKGISPFPPVTDGHFLTDSPFNLIRNGHIANKVPLIMGITEKEGIFMYGYLSRGKVLDTSDETVKRILAESLSISPNEPGMDTVVRAVKDHYFDGVDISDKIAVRDKFIDLLSDGVFDAAHYETVLSFTKAGIHPFVYSYDYRNHSMAGLLGLTDVIGATHAEDLYFMFDSQLFQTQAAVNDPETNTFLQLWVNFAKYGNPTPKGSSEQPWIPAVQKAIPVYHLAVPITVDVYNPENDSERTFWMQKIPSILAANEKKLREDL